MAETPMREERKVVTALFADIVGSTALGERFDPEDVAEIVGRAVARMVEAVEAFGGTVKDLAGDGLLALFGAPAAHEDDPERAVMAGMRILDDIRAHAADVQAEWGVGELGVRVGIETGLAVLGAVGGGSRVEYGATGDVVNTASRLQSQAAPFTVLVGPTTQRLAEPIFRWSDPRSVDVKGKAQPIPAFEVAGLTAVPAKPRGPVGMTTPLLGRDAELGAALEVGRTMLGGRGGILFLIGEPGIGKSRLLDELRYVVRAEGAVTWLEGRCVSYGQALPYWPFRDLLRGWLGATATDPPEHLPNALAGIIGPLFSGASDEVHLYLAAMLGVPLDPVAESDLAALSPEARAFRTTEAMGGLVRRLAADCPVVVAIEDLHWADDSSLQLLETLFPVARTHGVLIVASHRAEPDHPSWRLHGDAGTQHAEWTTVLALDALPPAAERSLLEAVVGPGVLPPPVEERILRTAEGNPFYLEELVRSLIDAGSLVAHDGRWRFEPGASVEIPPTVERIVISRLDRLSPPARRTIHAASVLGRQFELPLLEAVVGAGDVLSDAIRELLLADLVREEPAADYRFKHALIQEAAYNNMLKRHRRELHARTAEALESMLGDHLEPHFGVLAQHFRAANRPHEALRYFELAAIEARRIYAVAAALEDYTGAIEIAQSLGSDRIAELRLNRGRVRSQAGDFAEARNDFEIALGAAREAGDRALEVEALNELGFLLAGAVDYAQALSLLERSLAAAQEIGAREAQVAAAARLSIVYTNQLRLDLSLDRARRAWVLAREVDDERSLSLALDALQVASVMVGDMATVDQVSAALVETHRRRGDLWYMQWALFQWAWVDVAAARWDAAERRVHEGLAVNRQVGDRGGEAVFPALLAWIARARGHYGRALELARQALHLATELDHAEFVSWSAEVLGWTLVDLFATDDAVRSLELSLEAASGVEARIELIRAACHLPLARWLSGDLERAREDAARAELWLGEVRVPPGRAYLQGADGPIAIASFHVASGDPSRALEFAQPAIDAAIGAEWHEVVAAAMLVAGRARALLGDRDRACRALEAALDRSERFHLPGLAWRAHAELAEVGSAAASSAHAARARALVEALSESIGDESIRQTFLDGASAELSRGGAG